MPEYVDHLNRVVIIPEKPRRIVSVVPSQTELLFTLGLEESVVGITKFCVHPGHWQKKKTIIGGTKNLQLNKILALQPDLIIANKEENAREQIEALAARVPVWVSDVETIEQAYTMIHDIGTITGTATLATALIHSIKLGFQSIHGAETTSALPPTSITPRCTYLIWKDPFLTIGGDTFIHNMLLAAGFENSFAHRSRYPEISIQEIKDSGATHVFLSSEPYPFKEKHLTALKAQLPGIEILLVDGECFSWYGSRMLEFSAYFRQLI